LDLLTFGGLGLTAHFFNGDGESINGTFLAMAIRCGLTCPITNPLLEEVVKSIIAADLCMGRDEFATNWITLYRKLKKAQKA